MLTHTRMAIACIAGSFWFATAPDLGAQADTAAAATPKRAACWHPRPSAQCRGYLVTEFTLERAILTTSDDFDIRFVGTIGPMINRGRSEAWGFLASISTDDPDVVGPLRAEMRYRKWLGSRSGIDAAVGLTRTRAYDEMGNEVQLSGPTAAVSVQQGLLGVHARVDLLQGDGQSEQAVFAGVSAGGVAGPLSAAALVVGFYTLLMIAYSGM